MTKYCVFLVGFLFFSACEQDAFFTVPDGNSKIFAFSEISTTDRIKIDVHTSIGVNTDDEFTYPKQADAKIRLYEDGVEVENTAFRYIASQKKFVSQGSFRPKAETEYTIMVSLKDDLSIRPIVATTIIPSPEILEDIVLSDLDFGLESNEQIDVGGKLSLNTNELQNRFYLIKSAFVGESGMEYYSNRQEIKNGIRGAIYSKFKEGILIDASKIDGNLELDILALINSEDANSNLCAKVEVISITKDAYYYYKSFSKQITSQSAVISEPVISYTNIENGLGLFTGFSSSKTLHWSE